MMSSTLVLTSLAYIGVGIFVETKCVEEYVPFLYEPYPVFRTVARVFGFIILFLTAASIWHISLVRRAHHQRILDTMTGMISIVFFDALDAMIGVIITVLFTALVFPLITFVAAGLWCYGQPNDYAEKIASGHWIITAIKLLIKAVFHS